MQLDVVLTAVAAVALLVLTRDVVSRDGVNDLTDDQVKQLEDFIETLMQCRQIAGLSIAMVRGDSTVYSNGFGFRDVERHLPLLPTTRIAVGSITKTFTSTLVADVVSRGLLDWDTPLRDVLGDEFRLPGGDHRTDETTIRDVLAHRVGIPTYWGVSTAALNVSREELVRRMAYFAEQNEFRETFTYSNYLYVLAGWVTEVLTGTPWEEHIRQTILDPLGMKDSRLGSEMTEDDWHNTTGSYTYQDGIYTRNPEEDQLFFINEIAPAGSLFSTADDMAAWIRFHLTGGASSGGDQLIDGATLAETYSRTMSVASEFPWVRRPQYPANDDRVSYALGWYDGVYNGYQKRHHTGSYSSYDCRLSMLPEVRVGIWSCVNSPGDYRGSRVNRALSMFALDLLLDEEPWLDAQEACVFQLEPDNPSNVKVHTDRERPIPHTPAYKCSGDGCGHVDMKSNHPAQEERLTAADEATTRPISDYTGEYYHPAFGLYTVYLTADDAAVQQLRYSFGVLLSGVLTRDPTGEPDTFYMTLEHPISYRHVFFPEFPLGFPVWFREDAAKGPEDVTIYTVEVYYLEDAIPPIFIKL